MITLILHKAKAVTANYKLEQMLGPGSICWLSLLIKILNIHAFQQLLHLIGNTDMDK